MFVKKEDADFRDNKLPKVKEAAKLKNYIRNNIPLTDFMDFNIDELTDYSIKLSAPIKPNGNHYSTAFGGSIATLGILSGWALLHSKMVEEKLPGILVIQESKTKYITPARNDFNASCTDLTDAKWSDFKEELLQKGKAKLILHSVLKSDNKLIAKQESIYVGLAKA